MQKINVIIIVNKIKLMYNIIFEKDHKLIFKKIN